MSYLPLSFQERGIKGGEVYMSKDVLELLEEYIPEKEPRRWAKLLSTVDSRRLELILLREILLELRKLNAQMGSRSTTG